MTAEVNRDHFVVDEVIRRASWRVLRKGFLVCGILSAVVYLAANVIVPIQDPGYSIIDQTVSELSAIGAPTRDLWLMFMVPYGLLLVGFGVGVGLGLQPTMSANHPADEASAPLRKPGGELNSANPPKQGGEFYDTWSLRIVGGALVLQGILGFFWPPMHLRGAEMTLTDTLHIAFALIVVPLMIAGIWFSRPVVGKSYAIATIAIVFAFGAMTGFYGSNIAANLPTPWVGVWERIGIAAWVIWVVVLAAKLWPSSRA